MTDPQTPPAPSRRTAAVIVAAGRGLRAGGGLAKQWRSLAGTPVLSRTLAAFRAAPEVSAILLVVHPDEHARASALLRPGERLVEGGASRDASVRNALEALDGEGFSRVLIHDGARPLVSPGLITRVAAALEAAPAAAPALAVTDALWRGDAGRVQAAVPRDGLWRAQTPQGFHFPAILAAHRARTGPASDDVEVALAAGLDVAIVEGEEDNLKLTFEPDFARAEAMLRGRKVDFRIGNGFDVHAFGPGDHVWLCGVKIAHSHGLVGHSDADVGMHALTDALYGALAEGDIGRHFPPTNPEWKGAASHIFLSHAMKRVRARGYRLANCDVTLICERPKIGPHALDMQAELSRIMEVEMGCVSVKATTSERLGFTGREEGIAALATAALVQA